MDMFLNGLHDSSGQPLKAYKVYFWTNSGASTEKTVWSDIDKTTVIDQSSGVTLGNKGELDVYGDGEYYVQVKTPAGVLHDSFTISYSSTVDFGGLYIDVGGDYGVNGASMLQAINDTNSLLKYVFLFKDSEFTLSANLEFPSHIIVKVHPSATFALSGYDLTINRTPDIGDYQAFTGVGNVIYGSLVESTKGIWRNGDAGAKLVDFKTGAEFQGDVNFNSDITQNGKPILRNINTEYGYVYKPSSGNFECSQSATPGQSVQVDDRSSSVFHGSDGTVYISDNTAIITVNLSNSDASNPRWDLVELDASAGTYSVVDGTAAANPTYPSGTAGKDSIAYVYRKASTAGNTIYDRDILDARVSIKNKNVDGHFKTNFSINQKEDTEPSEYDNQQMFQRVPFGTKFDYVQEDKANVQYIDTILVPADSVNGEIVYSGTWGSSDDVNFLFGRSLVSSTANSTAIFSFSGVSCNLIYHKATIPALISVELSDDNGVTYHSKKTLTTSNSGGTRYKDVIEFYQGLDYGDYKVKITVLDNSSNFYLEAFSYATYLVQTPMTQKALLSQSPTDIDDVPPLTTLVGGTWTYINSISSSLWNNVMVDARANNATLEYKFYGSSIYINVLVAVDYDAVFSVEIDGSTTYVKNSSISLPNYAANRSVWVRLDNGSLPEGVHTVKVTTTTSSSTDVLNAAGWAHYSSKYPSTCARSLICGKDSYAVGSDSTDFTYSGSWTQAGQADSMLGRYASTNTNSDYVTITTPANVKAIYLVNRISTTRGEVKVTLGGASSNIRYFNSDTDNVTQGAFIQMLYDSHIDGISLDSQELRITKNSGTIFVFEGVIFEIGDAVESDSIFCMPKWTRYNNSVNQTTVVSTSHRLDVYGSKSDGSTGRQPMVHSGFVYHSSGSSTFYRHGLNMQDMNYKYERGGSEPKVYHLDSGSANDLYNFIGDYGLIATGSYSTNEWIRISLFPNRVI